MRRILFIPNWMVHSEGDVTAYQAPDRQEPGEPYWFFRHFRDPVQVDVLDTRRTPWPRLEERYLHFYLAQGLVSLVRAKSYDLVMCHSSQSAVTLLGAARLLRRHLPKTVVIDPGCLNMGYPEKHIQWNLARWALEMADAVVWHSSSSIDLCAKHAPSLAEKGHFIPLGIETASLDSGHECEDQHDPYVLCTGAVYRDWRTLIDAWRGISHHRLVLVGADRRVVDRSESIVVTPRLPFKEYRELLLGARLVVLPIPEGWGSWGQTTLLQAMAAGKAVVTTAVRPIADYAGDGCFVVPNGDEHALHAAMRVLLQDEKARQALQDRARSHVSANFTEDRMATSLESLCWSLLK